VSRREQSGVAVRGCVETGGVEVVMTGANVYSAYAEGSQSYSAARKRRAAFEANAAAAGLQRIALLRALGAAHVRVRHSIEARTSFRIGLERYYVMLQTGLARRQHDMDVANDGPLAERVMARIDQEMLESLSSEERARVAAAIDNAEITRQHALDVRATVPMPGLRGYVNLIAGLDKRGDTSAAYDNRRAPANETVGFLLFMLMVFGATTLGAALIASTLVGAVKIASDPEGRSALWRMTTSLFGFTSQG
jgi:hypothetical protein